MREIKISRNMINKAVELAVEACSSYAVSKSLVRIFTPSKLLAKIACIGVSSAISEVVVKTVKACGLTDDITDLVIKALKKRDNVIITDKIPQEAEEESVETSDISTDEESEEEEKTEETNTEEEAEKKASVAFKEPTFDDMCYITVTIAYTYILAKALLKLSDAKRMLSKCLLSYLAYCTAYAFVNYSRRTTLYRGNNKEAIA